MIGSISVILAVILQPILFIVFLRLAVAWVCKFKMSWGQALKIGLPALGVFILGGLFAKSFPLVLLVAAVAVFIAYALGIKTPEQQPIKYLRAFLVMLIQLVLTILIVSLLVSVPFVMGIGESVMNMEQQSGTVVEFEN